MIKDQIIILINSNEIISEHREIVEQFSGYFQGTEENLVIGNKSTISGNGKINAIIKKLEKYPSIQKVKENSSSGPYIIFFFCLKVRRSEGYWCP